MDSTAVITLERFAEGMAIAEYVEGMSTNRELFQQRYDSFQLREKDAEELRRLGLRLKVLVLLEDWCGDVLRYVPVFARMAEAAGTWEVRLFCRDEHLDMADTWRKNGQFRAIPVIVFFDETLHEVGCFIEKPAAVSNDDRNARDQFARKYPHLTDSHVPSVDMSPDTYSLYVEFIREFRANNTARWQAMFVEEVLEKLRSVPVAA
jgi:hypothetical protein